MRSLVSWHDVLSIAARSSCCAFSPGVIDLQVLLGVITLVTRPFFPALIGHIVMMVAAAAVAHLGAVRLKKQPANERSYTALLVAGLLPLVIMVGGILALQRPII